MRSQVLSEKEWISLKEASKITGKSVHALQLMISRGKLEKVRKQGSNGHGYWEIHKEVLKKMMGEKSISQEVSQEKFSGISHEISQVVTMPTEAFFQQQKERDDLMQGLMMYRYKFEMLEKQTRLLPAPLEIIPSKLLELEQKERALREELRLKIEKEQTLQKELIELEGKVSELDEKELALSYSQEAIKALEEALQQERQRSWWDRLWRK